VFGELSHEEVSGARSLAEGGPETFLMNTINRGIYSKFKNIRMSEVPIKILSFAVPLSQHLVAMLRTLPHSYILKLRVNSI